jgi:hypothetical protein
MNNEDSALERARRAREILAEVDSVVEALVLPKDLSIRAVGGAGLIRCRHLLEGMLILFERQSPGAIGALARVMFETWVCTMYVILGGEEALRKMLADAYSQTNPWVKGRNPDLDELLGDRPAKRMSFRATCAALGQEMEARGLRDWELPLRGYETVYRIESGTSVHGGLAALMLPLIEPGSPELAERPSFDHLHAARRIAFSSFLLAYLSYWRMDAHDLPNGVFEWSQTDDESF